jgi:hypothetical protein
LRTEPKVVLKVVPGGLEKSTSSLLESRGYFCLEAHQVLRLAYIVHVLTLTPRNGEQAGLMMLELVEAEEAG